MKDARPNILLLHTDQQRFDTIAALGASHMHTPNLDRLAGMGVHFTHAYSSNPVCQPARHDLITGVSARHHGYFGNTGRPVADYGLATIPRLLTEAGYQTIAVGKMHFTPPREHHGFAHMYLMEELPDCRENDAYLQYLEEMGYGHIRCQHGVRPLFYHTPQPSRVPEEHHGSAWVAHKTIELLRTERDRPFFIFASWVGPHPPYYVPKRYLDLYKDQPLPQPKPMPERGSRQCPVSPENPEPDSLRMRRLREAYYAATTCIDTHIGRILDELESSGQMENTLVVFMTDHGEMLGDRGHYQKMGPYDGAARIPLLAAGLGLPRGQRVETPATTWDVSATLLDAAGVTPPQAPPFLGSSLLGDTAGAPDRTIVFHNATGRGRYVAAVGQGWKLIHWFNGGDEELYCLADDPDELRNLIDAPRARGPADRLRRTCIEFERDHGVAANVRNDAFVDQPYRAPPPHSLSMFPLWSSHQFPPWTTGYSQEDLDLIAAEMRDCLKSDTAYICREPEWRADALGRWEAIGGDPAVYRALFDAVDRAGK
ncbi:MAG: sulfatase-like hydrolase/transferase [Kiritimatiellaeota bacterium]|nr:sulfatase-like hydrolase/transferase [Kiritimatiellota bacterium]